MALAERLIRFYAYPGAHILDPFAGSGSTGLAALRLGCRATLVDIDGEYCRLAAGAMPGGAESRVEREFTKADSDRRGQLGEGERPIEQVGRVETGLGWVR